MANSKLYVGNLSFKTTEDELRTHFGQFGTVTDVYVAMDKMTGRPRGFAFVTMGSDEEAKDRRLKNSNGTEFGGRQLTVNEAPSEGRTLVRRQRRWRRRGFGGGGGERRGGLAAVTRPRRAPLPILVSRAAPRSKIIAP